MKFRTIVADPPWPYRSSQLRAAPDHRPNSWSGVSGGVSSVHRYGSMSMANLKSLPVERFCDENAHLYLWTTNSFMEEAHHLSRAWGFSPKTIITWVKIKASGVPSMKMGYYFRGATEHVLFSVRGVGRLIGPPIPTVFFHPRLPHSEKPDAFREIVSAQSPGPVLELFARKPFRDWKVWGNQVECDVALPVE